MKSLGEGKAAPTAGLTTEARWRRSARAMPARAVAPMPIEIERRFLVVCACWRAACRKPGERLWQGYLVTGDGRSDGVTVRVRRVGRRGIVTVMGPGGPAREEFEYEVPADEAEEMLTSLCRRPLLERTRHEVEHGGMLWFVDEFHGGRLAGLTVAEVEPAAPDQPIAIPPWAGLEVTGNPAFRDSALATQEH